jgi:glycosyltransferase involved in cell wall biosynthesis
VDVSVIIPAFNAEQTIAASVASILAARAEYQIEILVVDDASTDNTWACLQSLAAQFPEVKPLKNLRRKGPSGARNTGLDAARGSYIAFLDADDIWYSNHLQLGIGFLQSQPKIDAIIFDQDILDADSGQQLSTWVTEKKVIRQLHQQALGATEFVFEDNLALALLNESFLHLQTLLTKRSAIGDIRFDEDVFRSEDVDFGIHLYLAGCRFAYSTVATGIYYRNNSSLTAKSYENDIKTACDRIHLLHKYRELPAVYRFPDKMLRAMICERLMKIAYPQRKLGQKSSAFKTVLRSFGYQISWRQCIELAKALAALATK